MPQKNSNRLLIAIVVGAIVLSLNLFLAWNSIFNSWGLADYLRALGWHVDYDVFEPFGIPCCLFSPAFAAIAGAITFKIVGTKWQRPATFLLLGLALLIAAAYVTSSVGWGATVTTPTPIPWKSDL